MPVGDGRGRPFVLCPRCRLVFVPSWAHVSAEAELARYALHERGRDDEGYRSYLAALADEVDRMPPTRPRILDVGSGPAAVLTELLVARGYDCRAYDPLYDLGLEHLAATWDLLVLCEVIEHFRDLGAELDRMRCLLAPGGYVLVKTEFYPSVEAVPSWWYGRDETHVNFFDRSVMDRVALRLGLVVTRSDGRRTTLLGPAQAMPRA